MMMAVIYLGIFGVVYGVIWLTKRGYLTLWSEGLSEVQLLILLVGGGIILALASLGVSYMASVRIVRGKEY